MSSFCLTNMSGESRNVLPGSHNESARMEKPSSEERKPGDPDTYHPHVTETAARRRRIRLALCAAVVFAATSLTTGTAHAAAPPLKVSIIGDSFSAGVGASAGAGYATVLAARGCWDSNLVAESGSGYAASPNPFVSLQRVTKAASTLPDVIVIQGSGNDRGDARLFAAATGLYATFRVIAPQARIVVVAPTGAPNAKHDNIDAIRRTLRDAAQLAGVTFLDPRAEGWLNFSTDYAPDGIHPNTRGHARMADRLFDDLVALGIPRVDSC